LGEITASSTVVRGHLISLSPTERDANNAPRSVFRQRLIFSIDGFANLYLVSNVPHILVRRGDGWVTGSRFRSLMNSMMRRFNSCGVDTDVPEHGSGCFGEKPVDEVEPGTVFG
jgi:hypothetical protein